MRYHNANPVIAAGAAKAGMDVPEFTDRAAYAAARRVLRLADADADAANIAGYIGVGAKLYGMVPAKFRIVSAWKAARRGAF